MFDLHTHILPGIDDGAPNQEEALKMTEALLLQKVRAAVCTPHFDARKTSLNDFLQKRTQAMNLMKASKLTLMNGSEAALNDYLFHYPDLSPLCIQDTKYILIELPFTDSWDTTIYDMLDKLIQYHSLYPIIAHIERYPAIGGNKTIKKLIELGCYLQVNSSSILNEKSWHKIAKYMKRGYIDVISSDCHNMLSRPPVLIDAYHKIKMELGDESYLKLIQNTEAIINGKELRDSNLFTL